MRAIIAHVREGEKNITTRAIITDIEGTTSSLSFVKDVLFPYARRWIAEFVRAHRNDSAVQPLLVEIQKITGSDFDIERIIDQLHRWIDEDKKITPLKALQGLIWEEGYRRGEFKGHVYADALHRLRKWHDRGIKLYVFSSGSVQAQKLLFGFSDRGDLTPLFAGYFDTTIGAKKDPAAYRKIADAIGEEPPQIVFLSDIEEELDAARAVGMRTFWLVRDGMLDPAASHTQVKNFDQISL